MSQFKSSSVASGKLALDVNNLMRFIVLVKGSNPPEVLQQSEGEDGEVTIINYYCGALFVLLSRVRYGVCQHGGFDFRLASVARPGA